MALHLADLLGGHWENYAHAHRHQLTADHYRAVRRVLACRTPVQRQLELRADDN